MKSSSWNFGEIIHYFCFPKKPHRLEVPVREVITVMVMGMVVGMVAAVTVKVQMAEVLVVTVQTVMVQMVMDQVEAIPVRTGVVYRTYQEFIPNQN